MAEGAMTNGTGRQDRTERKLSRLRQSPAARVLVLQGPEARAGYGILLAIDRGLGLAKRLVPHRIELRVVQRYLQELKAVTDRGRRLCEERGILVDEGMIERFQSRSEQERIAALPMAQVFIPHHEETRVLCQVLSGVNSGCVQARARLSAETCETEWFVGVMAWLQELDRVAQSLYAMLEQTDAYRPPRLLAAESAVSVHG